MFLDSACTCFSHWKHQKNHTRRKPFFRSCLQDPPAACFVISSGGESCPGRAKIHHLDFQNLVCSHPSRGRNQPSRLVSFGALSTLHRLLFGHNKHRKLRHCQGWLCRHRFFVVQLCKVQRSSCTLKVKCKYSFLLKRRLPVLVCQRWISNWKLIFVSISLVCIYTVESQFLELSVFRNSRLFEPNLTSIHLKHCNFTPDFSNHALIIRTNLAFPR